MKIETDVINLTVVEAERAMDFVNKFMENPPKHTKESIECFECIAIGMSAVMAMCPDKKIAMMSTVECCIALGIKIGLDRAQAQLAEMEVKP